MTRISEEAKQAIVKKALCSDRRSRIEIARSHNVGFSTLWKWIKRYKASDIISTGVQSNKPLSSSERFRHIQATYGLEDAALGAYCRKHGFYSHQIQQWKEDFMSKNSELKNQNQVLELKKLRVENKELKQELHRKDKALSETAALLILKKKASQIWGDVEDV
jgi:transposase